MHSHEIALYTRAVRRYYRNVLCQRLIATPTPYDPMNHSPEANSSASTLIKAYHEAIHKQRVAGRAATIALVLTVLLFVFLIWAQFSRFLNHDLTEFSANLGVEAAEFMPTVMQSVDEMTSRLVPVYIDNFTSVLQRDQPKYLEMLHAEFETLNTYATSEAWPQIEESIAQLVVDQELALGKALDGLLTIEQIADLSFAYREALENHLQRVFRDEFVDQTVTGEAIIAKLQQLALSEDQASPADSHYILGMLFELLGIRLQETNLFENPALNNF